MAVDRWLIVLAVFSAGCASAPRTPVTSPFRPNPPDAEIEAKIEKVSARANRILSRPKCVEFFDELPDQLPPTIGIEAAIHPDPTSMAWSDCERFPETVFLNIGYVPQLTVEECAVLAIHEAAHLGQCSTRSRTTSPDREKVSTDAERECSGRSLSIVVVPEGE